MDGWALRLTASGGPSSGHCRPAPRSWHERRALDADRCAGRRHPVLFSAATLELLLSLVASATLLERAAAAFPHPGARSRPFDPAAVRQNHLAFAVRSGLQGLRNPRGRNLAMSNASLIRAFASTLEDSLLVVVRTCNSIVRTVS